MVTLKSPCHRLKPPPLADSVMAMSKRNYRVIADVGITPSFPMIICAVLDTGAGTDFVRRFNLPSTDVHISSGFKPSTSDANGPPLNIVGKYALYTRFVAYVVKCHVYLCERLGTAYVLGGDF